MFTSETTDVRSVNMRTRLAGIHTPDGPEPILRHNVLILEPCSKSKALADPEGERVTGPRP